VQSHSVVRACLCLDPSSLILHRVVVQHIPFGAIHGCSCIRNCVSGMSMAKGSDSLTAMDTRTTSALRGCDANSHASCWQGELMPARVLVR
jgi:hypothetical protein